MYDQNITITMTEFVLLEFTQRVGIWQLLYIFFFTIYVEICMGNATIIITVIKDCWLHSPKYFFIANMGFIDINHLPINTPVLLSGLLFQHKTNSFSNCTVEMFFFRLLGGAQVSLLLLVSADWYVSIYEPLGYYAMMNKGVCVWLVAGSWLGGLCHCCTDRAASSLCILCSWFAG